MSSYISLSKISQNKSQNKNLGGKNDNNNRKLRLSKSIHIWLMNSNLEKIGEKESSKTLKKGKSDKKKYAALIMKILKRINEEMDKDTVLRNKIKNIN